MTITPPFRIPKSKAIVKLRVREGDEDAAQQRAKRIGELAFGPLLRNKRVEKISHEVTPIDKPALVPKMFSVIDGVATWFALGASEGE
ncbi:MAG: hypothetical protein WDN28_23525 [Chthoniobacter sp.]